VLSIYVLEGTLL